MAPLKRLRGVSKGAPLFLPNFFLKSYNKDMLAIDPLINVHVGPEIPAHIIQAAVQAQAAAQNILLANGIIGANGWAGLGQRGQQAFINQVEIRAQNMYKMATQTLVERALHYASVLGVAAMDHPKITVALASALVGLAASQYPDEIEKLISKTNGLFKQLNAELDHMPRHILETLPEAQIEDLSRMWYGSKSPYPVDIMIPPTPFTEIPPEAVTIEDRRDAEIDRRDYPDDITPASQKTFEQVANITKYNERKALHERTYVPSTGPGPATQAAIENPPINYPATGKGKKQALENEWQKHVKEYAKKHNLTFFQSLIKAKASYKKRF